MYVKYSFYSVFLEDRKMRDCETSAYFHLANFFRNNYWAISFSSINLDKLLAKMQF